MQQAKISPQEESKYLYEESASILKNILIETPNDTNTLVQLGILKYNQEKYGGIFIPHIKLLHNNCVNDFFRYFIL